MAVIPTSELGKNRRRARLAVAGSFFLQGLCFASWGSRIPAVQERFHLTEAGLGALLFALPLGLMASLPVTAALIARIGSKKTLTLAILGYASFLSFVGAAPNLSLLTLALFAFGFFGNAVNISVNTQAVAVEALYAKPVMATFHGLWSAAGFTGAGLGLALVAIGVAPREHFFLVSGFVALGFLAFRPYLLAPGREKSGDGPPAFARPDRGLLLLGVIAFCSMIAEGAMFDWSGVYFRDVVGAKRAYVGAGYTAFLSTMAIARFCADSLVHRFGARRMLRANGMLAGLGLLLAVAAPSFYPALLGFFLVGIGVSSVVPLVYSAAGKSGRLNPSSAISAVSTLGFLGFLLGPPFIGFVAQASSLRLSFFLVAILAFGISALAPPDSPGARGA